MASTGDMPHEHPAEEADATMASEEFDSNGLSGETLHEYTAATEHVSEKDTETKEAELLIKELNELGLGEAISEQESLHYFDNLACQPPRIDLKVKMSREELNKQDHRHALCRLRYYQYKVHSTILSR